MTDISNCQQKHNSQTLIMNVDIFRTICKLYVEIFAFRASSKFHSCYSQQKIIPKQLLQNKPQRKSKC